MRIPVVGCVATTGNGWEEAAVRLWLVSEAVESFISNPQKDPRLWTDEEWKATLKTMRDILSVKGSD